MSPIVRIVDNLERRSKRHLKYQRVRIFFAEWGECVLAGALLAIFCVAVAVWG